MAVVMRTEDVNWLKVAENERDRRIQSNTICRYLRNEMARLENEKMSLINQLYLKGLPEPKEWQG